MKIGFSLSPGGLLLPYHLGVLESLHFHQFLDDSTPIAGSSAGAIAVASWSSGVDPRQVLESTIAISDQCRQLGGARGRLLPLLRETLGAYIGDDELARLQQRQGATGIAYRELFPRNRPILQTKFDSPQDLVNSICHSSMFPFFSSNWPCALDFSQRIPRLVVDGFFSVPRENFGCPDFAQANVTVDRTVRICVFPQEAIGMDSSSVDVDCIAPEMEDDGGDGPNNQMRRLLQLATESSSREVLTHVYDAGFQDAERWCRAQSSNRRVDMEHESLCDSVQLNLLE